MTSLKDKFLIGIGIDTHFLKKSKSPEVTICGLHLDIKYKIIAHSDGDAVLHAIADAILGAIGENDIGYFFKDNDPKNYKISSTKIINKAIEQMNELRYSINNVDIVLISNQINVSHNKEAFVSSLKEITGCNNVNIKGKTWEKRSKQTTCHAIVSLFKI